MDGIGRYLIVFVLLLAVLASLPAVASAEVIGHLRAPAVALTFDACETVTPAHFDERILDYLVGEKIPFTIFVSGKFAIRNQARLKELAMLHFVEIENHSFSHHLHMEQLHEQDVQFEVQQLEAILLDTLGRKTRYFRFPGGNCDARTVAIVEQMGYKVVHWAFPSGDPDQTFTPTHLTDWVLSRARLGDILIFHINGRGYSTASALPGIVATLRDKGAVFVKLEGSGI